ncbi:MAG: hypothetical protein ACI85V_002246 [bacterium]
MREPRVGMQHFRKIWLCHSNGASTRVTSIQYQYMSILKEISKIRAL